MKTDFSEPAEVQPLLANCINRLLAIPRIEEEFGLVGDSAGFPEEDVKRNARVIAQVIQLNINMPSSTWGTAVDFPSLATENILLRREIEQIKHKLAELEERMPKEKVIVLKEISREQAKQEVRQLFTSGRTLYYSDIAEELGLDLELVVDICRELEENREVKVDKSAL